MGVEVFFFFLTVNFFFFSPHHLCVLICTLVGNALIRNMAFVTYR